MPSIFLIQHFSFDHNVFFQGGIAALKADAIHFEQGINAVFAQAIEDLLPFCVACFIAENGEVNVGAVVVIAPRPRAKEHNFIDKRQAAYLLKKIIAANVVAVFGWPIGLNS